MTVSRIQFRRATAAAWSSANPILFAGEAGFETDTGKFKIGNGSTAWNSLAYAATNIIASSPIDYNSSTYILSIQDATTSQKGAVQLEDSTSSTSTSKAATPNSVKSAYDLANNAVPQSAVGSTVASLSGGKIPNSQIPAIAITDTFVVNTQSAMLALSAEIGDIAIRTEINKTFILSTNSPSTLADWKELLSPLDAVSSVDGRTGVVTLSDLYVGKSSLGTNVQTFLTTPSSSNLASVVTDETGSGALVFANSPTLVSPALGTPTSLTLSNATGLPISGINGLGTNVGTFLATPSSANLASAITDETGSGSLVFATSPTLVTPTLGAATATTINSTSIPTSKTLVVTTDKLSVHAATTSSELAGVISDKTGTGSLVFASSPTLVSPALGTPTSLTLNNATGLPISGITGLGTGVGTWLGTPSSANLYTAVTDRTGTGGGLVFATSPTLTTPVLGVASATSINGTSIPSSTTLQSYAGPTVVGSTQSSTTLGNNFSINATTTLLRYTGTANATITGFSAAGATPVDGRTIYFLNASAFIITMSNQSASSTAAYRFSLPGSIDVTLAAQEGILLIYDATSTTWRAAYPYATAGNTSSAGPTVLGTVQSFTTTGTSNNVALTTTATIFRYTGVSASTITGFSDNGVQPVTGRTFIVQNASSTTVTLVNNSVSSTSTNRLSLPASTVVLNLNESAMLIYDGSVWRMATSAGSSGDAITIALMLGGM